MIKVGIDIGNSKISCIVCDIKDDNRKVLSFVSKPTNSVYKSLITDVEKIKKEIEEVILQAAEESQTKILSINLNIPAVDSFSKYFESSININNEKVSDLHIKKAINKSNFLEESLNSSIVYRSITNYELDNTEVNDPRGMFGNNLKVKFYKFSVKENYIKTVKTIFDRLEIHIENYIPSPLSSSLAVLNQDDKLLGTICIDLGSSSTSVSVFINEKLIFIDSIKVGGMHITKDLARKFSTTIDSAERLKTLYGSVMSSPSDEYELIDVPQIGSDPIQFSQINRGVVNSIIKPRVEETLELVWQKLKDYGFHNKKIKNVVITGGGSLLEGIDEYVGMIFDGNVRIGEPSKILGLKPEFYKPLYSQTVGTIYFNKKNYEINLFKNSQKNNKNTVFSRFSSWLDQYI